MKATKTKYTCDHCGAESEFTNETPLGWFEVVNMSLGDEYHICPKCVRPLLFEEKTKTQET